ncbi:MAG: hypothetical protein SGI96_22090 [Bacteroidota bacterium]|nr:hypothetical protein [Bacteroidota bacterium]
MKKVLLSLAIAAIANSSNAQKETGLSFDKKTSYLHLGVGFGGGFYTGSIEMPPVSASFETAVSEKVSVGGIIAYSSANENLGFSNDDAKYTYLLIGARGNYHFATSEKFDPYVGLTLGYNVVSAKLSSTFSNYQVKASALIYGGQIGANYYFSPKFGAFAELGYGIGILTIGITAKL